MSRGPDGGVLELEPGPAAGVEVRIGRDPERSRRFRELRKGQRAKQLAASGLSRRRMLFMLALFAVVIAGGPEELAHSLVWSVVIVAPLALLMFGYVVLVSHRQCRRAVSTGTYGHSWRVGWMDPDTAMDLLPGSEAFVRPLPRSRTMTVVLETTPAGVDLVTTRGELARLSIPWDRIAGIDFVTGYPILRGTVIRLVDGNELWFAFGGGKHLVGSLRAGGATVVRLPAA